MVIVPSNQVFADEIPAWVKEVAKFWVDDEISDKEFGDAMVYLVSNDIVKLDLLNDLKLRIILLEHEKTLLLEESAKKTVPVQQENDDQPSIHDNVADIDENDSKKVNLIVTHYNIVYNSESYRFSATVFDVEKYNGDDFSLWYGILDGVTLNATIQDRDGVILREFSGVSKNGFYSDTFRIPDNWAPRAYTLNMTAQYNGFITSEKLEFFVIGHAFTASTK